MTTRMLIDARHREETRVAVIKGNRIEELDFESAEHKQLKGNIYLAKVTRVEPSLQAAFVEYGGNRHGFLAFSEIHPDYYQIPKEDREALLREEAEHVAAEAAMRAEEEMESLEGEIEDVRPPEPLDEDSDHHDDDGDYVDNGSGDHEDDTAADDDDQTGDRDSGDSDDARNGRSREQRGRGRGRGRARGRNGGDRGSNDRDEAVDFRRSLHRRYKIQDVIRRRQVLLVQVVKEERGSKGAALTSYLSLAGRYCVLMPNSSHGGGISRKISNGADRKRLKSVIDDLGLPPSMGCIVRTAGLERTKTEIKRDFDYLARLWDEIREKTLSSEAPALIHSDSDLIKRAIRDIYNSGIEDVLVEGDDGYRAAKDFMKLLMPSHARRVKQYADPVPLFQRYGVEDQLGAMYQPVVPLKSGGYLVINPTEALVSIDINSGRSTREHNIEQTAYNTNLEAAYEIARQLRLRDMAGLVVIDFIDMENSGNVRRIERAMRDALKNDRARIQVGRISGFGLMEMSRQRLRTGVLEASTRPCPHCEGTGLVRTASSAGLSALRVLEEEAARGRGSRLTLRASQEASFYVLNNKRAELQAIESRYGVSIEVLSDGETEGARMAVEAAGPPPIDIPRFAPIIDEDDDEDVIPDFADDEDEDDVRPQRRGRDDGREGGRDGDNGGKRRRGRRRRGRRGDDDRAEREGAANDAETVAQGGDDNGTGDHDETSGSDERSETGEGRRRRRGRRGGRNRRGEGSEAGRERDEAPAPDAADAADDASDSADAAAAAPVVADAQVADGDGATAPKPRRRRKSAADEGSVAAESVDAIAEPSAEVESEAQPKKRRARTSPKPAPVVEDAAQDSVETPEKKPRRTRKAAAAIVADDSNASVASQSTVEPGDAAGTDSEEGPRRRGWWQRTFGA